MKVKVLKLLHLLGLDALLLGLFEKLALWTIKELQALLSGMEKCLEKAKFSFSKRIDKLQNFLVRIARYRNKHLS